jgi:DNA-binding transcriptional MerR regulator
MAVDKRITPFSSGSLWITMPRHTIRTDRAKKRRDDLVAKSLTVASPSVGTPRLTVGQIAERISTGPADAAATLQQLRHWTREGFLLPVSGHHDGTGKHRRYEQDIVYDGAILKAFARAGLHVVTHRYLLEALSMARDARQRWERSKNRRPLFLEISHRPAGGDAVIAVHEGAVNCDPAAELSIVINLTEIFKNVPKNET